MIATAEEARRSASAQFLGRSWLQAATEARSEVVSAALTYTRAYRDVDLPTAGTTGKVLMAGHQSELFHPGVWFKNFALGRLGQLHGATPINLVIDNDAFKAGAIRVPCGPVTSPHLQVVALDRSLPDQGDGNFPAEEREIVDPAYFASFPQRVSQRLAGLVDRPLLNEFWPLVLARSRETQILGTCLAQARHQFEGRWGNATLELPFSHLCRTEAFARFATQVLLQLPALWSIYNAALHEYRRAHRLRSVTHPVPDLARDGEFLEAPLWVWRGTHPRRQRLFVRHRDQSVVLTDREGWEMHLPADGESAAQQLAELTGQAVKIRTKALFTTLFARLFLCDLFLHGIGGAKYDALTDVIAERWLSVRPPAFMTLSATLHLPLAPAPTSAADDLRRIDDELRRLIWQPERRIVNQESGGYPVPRLRNQESGEAVIGREAGVRSQETEIRVPPDAASLVRQKQELVAEVPTIHTAKTRCRAIRETNLRLQEFVENRRQELQREREKKLHQQRAYEVLSSREFAWCLFPAEILRSFMLAILPASA